MTEYLWTPWRLQYVAGAKHTGCIFCAAVAQQNDRETFIVHRGQRSFVMLNKYPYNNGHLMVVPYEHTAELAALNVETHSELMALIAQSIQWLKLSARPDGFNVGLNLGKSAGAGIIEHLHFHVVPRWTGDTNFMTITSETRVIPEWLDETWARLRAVINHEQR
jgi:ATP adenylyltransferase